jgi:hypothetical protein
MPSPFPGMDPYLEGYLWPDVHQSLANEIRNQLMPLVAPKYVARVVPRTVIESMSHGGTIGITIPDVEVFSARRQQDRIPERSPVGLLNQTVGVLGQTTTAPFKPRQRFTYPVDIASVEIRTVAGNRLITSIEILSPSNKTRLGWQEYQAKRMHVLEARANLVEIDLLRRGIRPVSMADAPRAPYYILLTRASNIGVLDLWPVQLRDELLSVPVPLQAPDEDVTLNLQSILSTIYTVARYDLSIDYQQPPAPPLTGQDAEWVRTMLE